MNQPATRYAPAGEVNIAYQVFGEGPVDLVWVIGLASNIDTVWEEPLYAAFLRRLSEFARVILFDRRGCGLSDRDGTTVTATLEERVDDLAAVLDTVGSEQASIIGFSEGGSMAALFAATHPERTRSIVLYGTMSRWRRDAAHPWGWADQESIATFFKAVATDWGMPSEVGVTLWAPSMVGDERFTEWMAKYARSSLSPRAVEPLLWSFVDYDLAEVFSSIQVPTLVLHRRGDMLVPIEHGRRIAGSIPGATLVELEGQDHLPFVGDAEAVLAEVEDFLVGSRASSSHGARLLTVAFVDIADSSNQLAGLREDAGRLLWAEFDRVVKEHVVRFRGDAVTHLGDDWCAAFDGPARAIRWAYGIADAAARLGLSARAGLHTGECDVAGSDLRGSAVQVAGRLVKLAMPGEILVSGIVRDLVSGAGIRFGASREVELRGLDGTYQVLPVLRHGAAPETVRRLAADQTNLLRRDGDFWTVGFQGLVVTVRDSKGMRDLARLIASSDHEVHALDLASEGTQSARSPSSAEIREAGLHPDASGGDPVIDDVARAAYRQRIVELEAEIEEAHDDSPAVATARLELDALAAELSAAYGLGGHPRRTPVHVERARKAVTRRIRDAIKRIHHLHPSLGRHLTVSVRTGIYCVYAPERPVVWEVVAKPGART